MIFYLSFALVSMSPPEAQSGLSDHVCPRISHKQRYANAMLIYCEYPHRRFIQFTRSSIQKSPSPTVIWKRDLKSDSKCSIIAHGIQASRVPIQIRFICREYVSSLGLLSREETVGLILLCFFSIARVYAYFKYFQNKYVPKALIFQCFFFLQKTKSAYLLKA